MRDNDTGKKVSGWCEKNYYCECPYCESVNEFGEIRADAEVECDKCGRIFFVEWEE
jgi:hypothetical protein